MELFSEVKNKYFTLITEIINFSQKGLTKDQVKSLIDNGEYEEKAIGKDFKSFEGLMLNEYKEDNYKFLNKRKEKYYPIIENEAIPIPIRFTNVEKIWLKEALKDKKFRGIIGEDIGLRLDELIENKYDFNLLDIIEFTNEIERNDIKYVSNNYSDFRKILRAIKEEKEILYDNLDRENNIYKDKRGVPLKIEYSLRDRLFRISLYYICESRPILVNLHTISNIRIIEDKKCLLYRDEIIQEIKNKKYSLEPIVIRLYDKRDAMERCFMSFSSFERSSRVIGDRLYEMKIYYYSFEEDEVIRKLLGLGPFVKIIKPEIIKDKIIRKVKKAYLK